VLFDPLVGVPTLDEMIAAFDQSYVARRFLVVVQVISTFVSWA
jgi:hypothetical protein